MKKLNRIYISCPMQVDKYLLLEFATYAKKHIGSSGELMYWTRGTSYDVTRYKALIESVDVFVVVPPKNQFKFHIDSLPSGTRSELLHAINCGKRILLGYKSKRTDVDEVSFYSTSIDMNSGFVEGITGTKRNFEQDAKATIVQDNRVQYWPTRPEECFEGVKQQIHDEVVLAGSSLNIPSKELSYDKRILLRLK